MVAKVIDGGLVFRKYKFQCILRENRKMAHEREGHGGQNMNGHNYAK